MLRIDRKILRAILKLTGRDYDAAVLFLYQAPNLHLVDSPTTMRTVSTLTLPFHQKEIRESVSRLIESGYIDSKTGIYGGMLFELKPKSVHRFMFWFEELKSRFWLGFVTGIATTASGYLIAWILRIL